MSASGRMSAPRGGVCSQGVSASGGVSAPGASASGGGVCFQGGVCSQHALRQTPHVNRITDTSKNITLAITSLRPVTRILLHK